jgi:hypothetical protein
MLALVCKSKHQVFRFYIAMYKPIIMKLFDSCEDLIGKQNRGLK